MNDTQKQELKRQIDLLVRETLRLDRMHMDQKCVEAIAIEPEITEIKNGLMVMIEDIVYDD